MRSSTPARSSMPRCGGCPWSTDVGCAQRESGREARGAAERSARHEARVGREARGHDALGTEAGGSIPSGQMDAR
jgi:hypothetical protein